MRIIDSIERAIKSIREGKDTNHVAEHALRRLCKCIITERDVTWLNVGEELVSRRLSDIVKEEGLKSVATEKLAELEKCRLDTESLRGFLLDFSQNCNAFNLCFLSAGFGHWEEQYRARESGNIVDAMQQVKTFGEN